MTRRHRRSRASVLIVAMSFVLGTAGCTALAPSIPLGTPPRGDAAPATSSAPASGGSATGHAPAPVISTPAVNGVSQSKRAVTQQLGIQVYWHTSGTTEQVDSAAAKVLDYIVGLGANSVALSFPVYTNGVDPTEVYGVSGSTPSPATLGLVIKAAQARGLRVMLRPLFDETNIDDRKGDWRGTIEPPSVSGWFASYRQFLTPYFQLAQQDSVNYFDIGVELDSLVIDNSEWSSLDEYAAGIYHGEIDYSDNWSDWLLAQSPEPAANIGVDAYPDLDLPNDTSVSELTTAWEKWLEQRSYSVLENTVIQEVGIEAADGAYYHPAAFDDTGSELNSSIQINWFDAACGAARSLDMPGIYFWDVDSYAEPALGPTAQAGSFIGRGDQAIKACFASSWNS